MTMTTTDDPVRDALDATGLTTGALSADAERAAYERLAAWLAQGYRLSHGRLCSERLLTRSYCSAADGRRGARDMPCSPPGDDHPSLWLRDGVPAAYISQPYQIMNTDAAAMTAFARRYGLRYTVDPHGSWYWPDSTLLVIWRRATPPR